MAQTVCGNCNAQVFLGEAKCAGCGAPTPNEVASFGHDADAGGHNPPPPEGLDLIIQKQLTDNQIRDRGRAENEQSGRWMYTDDDVGLTLGATNSLIAMSKVERDRDGKVVWDPKHAIIGGIVVAVFVAIVAGYFYMQIKSGVSTYMPPTSIGR